MVSFRDKSGNIKKAFSFREFGDKIYIKFTQGGKEYTYLKSDIQILSNGAEALPFRVYSYTKRCYVCHKPTEIITYITFFDNPTEDVTFPWDVHRLLRHQNLSAHMQDSSIEYYGLNVIGDIEEFDKMLMEKYPDRIKIKYSQTQGKRYPMNVCSHCGNGQGMYFIYRDINEMIQAGKEIKLLDE